ncbi:MAG: bifunctional aspartate kinase/homoserine dehydrogenase I, partial [Bacteroidota bacterium]
MKVLKFGGTSVGSAENIQRVIDIVLKKLNDNQDIAVVFSAMGGVTNQLIASGTQAAKGDETYLELVRQIEEKHFNVIRTLIGVKAQSSVFANVKGLVNELEDLLRGVFLIRELSTRTLDLIVSFGERLSTRVIYECLRTRDIDVVFCDARELIKTDAHFGMAKVDFEQTNRNIRAFFKKNKGLALITGFIASTEKGETTTLG